MSDLPEPRRRLPFSIEMLTCSVPIVASRPFALQNMFELSSRLIGIYKVANQTRSVAIGAPPRAPCLNVCTELH